MAMRAGDTPVPIPNTMVKTRAADGTILETVWESRWPPEFKLIIMGAAESVGVLLNKSRRDDVILSRNGRQST